MATYIQQGEFVDYTPSGAGVAAGDVVALGDDFFGVALRDIADGEKGALATGGIFEFVSTGTVAAGALVFWDAENKRVSTSSADNTYIGRASAAAADNKCRVFLNATNIGEFTAITPGAAPNATQTAIADLTAAAPAAITAKNPADIKAAAPAAITADDPGEPTATVNDQNNTEILADVAAIRAEVVKLVTGLTATHAEVVNLVADAATLKTAVNAAKTDLAAVVAALPSAVLA